MSIPSTQVSHTLHLRGLSGENRTQMKEPEAKVLLDHSGRGFLWIEGWDGGRTSDPNPLSRVMSSSDS